MAIAYSKNKKTLKKELSAQGIVAENIGRQHPRFNMDGKNRYFFSARKKPNR